MSFRNAAAIAFSSLALTSAEWQVIPDTDFSSNLPQLPYGPGASAQDCADQCNAISNCVAVSWNSPQSPIHDGNCNFKCSAEHRTTIAGEEAVIVRPQAGDMCSTPPHPLPPQAADWAKRYAAGHLLWSPTLAHLMPYVGNGYIATHPLHTSSDETGTLYVSGLFNGVAVQYPCDDGFCDTPHRARVPTYRVTIPNADKLPSEDMDWSSMSAYDEEAWDGYAMDYELATLVQRHQTAGTVKVEARYYAHAVRRHVLVQELLLDNSAGSQDATVSLKADLGKASNDISFNEATTNDGVYQISGNVMHAETSVTKKALVTLVANKPPQSVVVAAGAKRTLFFITAVATTLDSEDPTAVAQKELRDALASSSSLRADHEAAWLKRWEQGHMEISGNLPLAQAVNASMYFIMSSIRPDWNQGLSPGGLASDGYNGHSFWDCETWMYPNLLLLQPDLAKSMLHYRLDRLDGARAKAKSYGYAGLMFPWESAFSGYEVQGSAGGKLGPWGQFEQHITGDIAFAANQYWQTSGDKEFLQSDLEPLLHGIADFWSSRVEKGDDSKYHINSVMCPDEYHSKVMDSVYTNYVAQLSLRAAIDACKVVGKAPGSNWSQVADQMYIPFDEKLQYHPEYAGYTQGTKIKQGDAILLGFPLLQNTSAKVRANDLVAYDAVTDPNGPAMTWAMFSVGWLEAGDVEKAEKNFLRGYANVQAPFNVWTETPHGGTVNFITGAGGFLQSVLYGYGGLRVRDDHLDLMPPPLPQNTTAITLKGVNYQGNRLSISVSADDISVQILSAQPTAKALTLKSDGKSWPLNVDGSVVTQKRAAKYTISPSSASEYIALV